MAMGWFNIVHRVRSFSSWYNAERDVKLSNSLVSKLQIPDCTKQFVFAIQEPQTKSIIYFLYVHGLSERSASDTETLIRAVQPDAVISDWSWAYSIDHDFGDGPKEAIPTQTFTVIKQCFLYRTNKYRYQNVARNCVQQEIFGVGYEKHHLVAQKTAYEIGSAFLMGSPRFFRIKPVKDKKQVPLFAEKLYQKLLFDVNNGRNVDTRDLSHSYRIRSDIEALRLINYRESKFCEICTEEQSRNLAAQGIREQAKKFKKIVVITGQDDLTQTGIKRCWNNVPVFEETKGRIKKPVYVTKEDSGVEFSSFLENDRVERRPVSLVAGSTASIAASFLCRNKMMAVIRREKSRIVPWFGFVAFATLLQYADAIASIPATPDIARLGRGIQSLQQSAVSQTMSPSHENRIKALFFWT